MKQLGDALMNCLGNMGEKSWTWILNDMGIISPENEIARKDVNYYFRAIKQDMPQMLAKILTADSMYKNNILELLKIWKLQPSKLAEKTKGETKISIKNAILKAQRNQAIDQAPENNKEAAQKMARDPSIPIYVTIKVQEKHALLLVEHRVKYIYLQPGHCHLCSTKEAHTAYHSYANCNSDIATAARKLALRSLTNKYEHLTHYITHPTEEKLQKMLGVQRRPKLPEKQQAAITEALLEILSLQPHAARQLMQ